MRNCYPFSSMTQIERTEEWNYRYDERLGMLCEDRQPTADEVNIARSEAGAAIKDLCQ